MESKKFAEDLIDFIYQSPTAFHAVDSVEKILLGSGYKKLFENDKWELQKEGKYFVTKNSSAVIAFQVGQGELNTEGFRIIGAHTDSPSFRVKPLPEIVSEESYLKLVHHKLPCLILDMILLKPFLVAV